MAKDAHDREDLLKDATAYSHRIELKLDGVDEAVFCGFRDGGALSFYWTPDDVFQFNFDRELRRAFWRERMIGCYKQHPHWLEPEGEGRVRLRRIPLSEHEVVEFTKTLEAALSGLQDALRSECFHVSGAVPAADTVVEMIEAWLSEAWPLEASVRFALHPGVGRKKN